ncbi:unnamed protein product, partial [Ectocarpus sp. 12 AP-2014]
KGFTRWFSLYIGGKRARGGYGGETLRQHGPRHIGQHCINFNCSGDPVFVFRSLDSAARHLAFLSAAPPGAVPAAPDATDPGTGPVSAPMTHSPLARAPHPETSPAPVRPACLRSPRSHFFAAGSSSSSAPPSSWRRRAW